MKNLECLAVNENILHNLPGKLATTWAHDRYMLHHILHLCTMLALLRLLDIACTIEYVPASDIINAK